MPNRVRFLLVALLLIPIGLCGCGDQITVTTSGSGDAGGGAAAGPHPDEIVGAVTEAWNKDPAGAQIEKGGKAILSLLQDIDSLNPYLSSSASASEIHDHIYPRLMYEQPNYNEGPPTFTPQLAERWEIAEDNLSIKFWLRENLKWSDGTPITSADVRFSWEAAKSPDVGWVGATIVDNMQDVEIHDDRHFTVKYVKASPYNLMDINDVQILAKHTFGAVPFSKWKGYGKWLEEGKKAAGGPWVLDQYETSQSIILKPNPHFWDVGKPYLAELEFKIFLDMGAMLNALLAGEVDVMNSIPPKDCRKVLEDEDLYLYTYVSRSYGYLGWNCKRWPFDDKRVRQAMTYAIDRENIVEAIFYGYADVAGPNIIRSMWASNEKIEPYPYDPDKAESLLQEAGWAKNDEGIYEKDGRPFEFQMITNTGNVVRKPILEFVQSNLAEIGVKVDTRFVDFNQMSAQLKAHNFQAYVGGWYIATKVDHKSMFHSTAVKGRSNYVNLINARVDEIIDEARIMDVLDPEIRAKAKALWDEWQDILYDEQCYTMVYEPRGLVGVSKRIRNARVTSLRWTYNSHEWWIPKDER